MKVFIVSLIAIVAVNVLPAVCTHAAPAVDRYIQAIASLPSATSSIPTPPRGYGAVRNEQTGEFLVLVPPDYCMSKVWGDVVFLGTTTYGSRIYGLCGEF